VTSAAAAAALVVLAISENPSSILTTEINCGDGEGPPQDPVNMLINETLLHIYTFIVLPKLCCSGGFIV
jgi:hypothetical protein